MTLKIFLFVSLCCSHSMSLDNGLLLSDSCPSEQSVRGSKGSRFEITIQRFQHECKEFLSTSEIKATKIQKGKHGLDVKLTINKERANITWNIDNRNQCYRNIYMLDVEYQIENSQGTGSVTYLWCFRYNVSNVSKIENEEKLKLYFDCISTVPDREAYLDIKLWSLQQNWSASTRSRRSVKSKCNRCIRTVKEHLSIGPIKSNKEDEKKRIKKCQCWNNSTIRLQTMNTKRRNLLIIVDNPNPYATVITVKLYEGSNTFPVFTVSSVEKKNNFSTNISCDEAAGTYTPALGYNCGDQEYSSNSLCQLQDVEGPSENCPAPQVIYVPPLVDIHHFTVIITVVIGIIVTVAATVIVFVYKHKAFHKNLKRNPGRNRDKQFKQDAVTRIEDSSEDIEGETISLMELPSRQIMFLDHTDALKTPLRKDCVNLIVEILQAVGIELLGSDITRLYGNWVDVVTRATKDEVTECLIIMSRELDSCHNSYMDQRDNSTRSVNSLDSTEYFSGAVLKALNDRYFCPGRVPFRIHILCLEDSDCQLCKQYITKYSSFMKENHEKNTFSYHFAKYLEDTKSYILNENVMPKLLHRLNGTKLPENASLLNEKFSELFNSSPPA